MFDRLILSEEVVGCRGEVIAARGSVLSLESIAEAGRRAPSLPRRPLEETSLAADVDTPLDAPVYRHLFAGDAVRQAVRRALLAVRLPEVLFEELLAMRRAASRLHPHAFATAAVAVRMLLSVVGGARAMPELAAAALLHDLGMRHLPPRLFRHAIGSPARTRSASPRTRSSAPTTSRPCSGAHPAVAAAQSHHWRCGQGYPALGRAPSRSIEVISVASAFAALTQPRPFRPATYDARGASDVLAAEAVGGHADTNTVKLLVHALRGGRGDPRAIRFGRERSGHGPEVNPYVHVPAPSHSGV